MIRHGLVSIFVVSFVSIVYGQNFQYGPILEGCATTRIDGTNGLVIVPDDISSPERAVEQRQNTTILIKSGTYNVNNFNINNGNKVKPFGSIEDPAGCHRVKIRPSDNTVITSDGWTIAGMTFDCRNGGQQIGNDPCIKVGGNAKNWHIRNNNVLNADKGLYITNNASRGRIQGNFIEWCQSCDPSDLVRIGDTAVVEDPTGEGTCQAGSPCHGGNSPRDIEFTQNMLTSPLGDRTGDGTGNDILSINGVNDTGIKIIDNLFRRAEDAEQFIDVKNNQGTNNGVEIAYNTFIGPIEGRGSDDGPSAPCIIVADIGDQNDRRNCRRVGDCPKHKIHHNYFRECFSVEEADNGNRISNSIKIGTSRFSRPTIEYNVDHNTKNFSSGNNQQRAADRYIYRRNNHIQSAVRYTNNMCNDRTNEGFTFAMRNNVFHQTRIEHACEGETDWDISNNVFSQTIGDGLEPFFGTGNSDDTIRYANTSLNNADFTIITKAHNQNGALPSPVINNASIGNDCKLNIVMTPYIGDGYNHGPMKVFNRDQVTVTYDGVLATHLSSSIETAKNTLALTMSTCPEAGQTVQFDATYGWCEDSANIGGRETAMNARCLAVTDQEVVNQVDVVRPRGQLTFFVDNDCDINGNGTTDTCGANGPWNSIKKALQTAKCQGMLPGDILQVKGDVSKDVTCENGGNCYFENNINPDVACSGITIENAPNEHVVVSGTVDIKTNIWVPVGNGVFRCITPGCGGEIGDAFPFTAWYNRGAGESRLNLIQTNRVCDTKLTPGTMRVNPSDMTLCVRLDNDASPTATKYFRIPVFDPFVNASANAISGVTVRNNPVGTGSFTVTRYRKSGIVLDAKNNQNWTVDGLELSWMMGRCLAISNGTGSAATKFNNNTVAFCGQEGIQLHGDTGLFEIQNNTVTDIQTSPVFEMCQNINAGCLPEFTDNGAGIRVTALDGLGGLVLNNTVRRIGGGNKGEGRGINLENFNQNVFVGENYIGDITDGPAFGYGIILTGSLSNEVNHNNVIRNNRIFNVDVCYSQKYGSNFPSQAGARNHFYNNTCVNPILFGMISEGSLPQDGFLNVQNNIFFANTTSPVFIQIDTPDIGWDNFSHNAFECDSCKAGQNIVNYLGTNSVKRPEDCTLTVDCLDDWNDMTPAISDNLYGKTGVITSGQIPTLNINNTSIAFDAGKSQLFSRIRTDYLGTPRPQFSAWDIGAHEVRSLTGPQFSIHQHDFQFYSLYMGKASRPLTNINENISVYPQSFFTLRFSLISMGEGTALKRVNLFSRRCTPICGGWSTVDTDLNASNGVFIVDHPTRKHQELTNNIMELDGRTFVNQGVFIDSDTESTELSMEQNHQIEMEYSLGVASLVNPGDQIEFHIKEASGADLQQYTNVPMITIVSSQ